MESKPATPACFLKRCYLKALDKMREAPKRINARKPLVRCNEASSSLCSPEHLHCELHAPLNQGAKTMQKSDRRPSGSHGQDWPAYYASQVNEKSLFLTTLG